MTTMPQPTPDPASGPGARKVTRRDVAKLAGVSDAVVSYTLNGGAPVAAATAARVRAAIEQLGYTPNASARALKLGSSRLIGVIVPDSTNPFWSELCQEVERVAATRGYAVLAVSARADSEETFALMRSLASRQVDGVLVASVLTAQEAARYDAVGVRWAMLNNPKPVPGVAGVGVDLARGAYDATNHLLDHGYRRIAFVGDVTETRYEGWLDALSGSGVEPGPAFESPFQRAAGYRAGQALAARHAEVDAVFVASDMLGVGVLRALHEVRLAIPGDVAVASFDGSYEAEYCWPGLTTVRQPIDVLAGQAVRRLLDPPESLEDDAGGLVPGALILRASCGCEAPVVEGLDPA